MSLSARVSGGESVSLTSFDGRHLRFSSARPFAPGQPLKLEVELGGGLTLELKSIGCARGVHGEFEVRARPSTLSRGARVALTEYFQR
jgi:hypothetical protein